MRGHLVMSEKERKRKSALDRVNRGELTLKTAAQVLGLSYRQCRRSYKRYRQEGDKGLVHRSRGRPSNHTKPASFRRKVLKRYANRYAPLDIGPTLAAEKLSEEGMQVHPETLRRWTLEEGLRTKRCARAKHRLRREQKRHFGQLVQMDGSHHRWFGSEHDAACLMNMVDDATKTTLAGLRKQETTEAAMSCLWAWIERYGIPQALYTDKKNVFVTQREPTIEEQLAGQAPLTAFGKACAKLGIQIITAHSPQAKGRVERNHGVYQDRFLKELALRGITTIATANKLLQNGFTDGLNAKFSCPPLSEQDFHRPLPRGMDLAHVFCFEATRVVQRDWIISYDSRHYQISRENRILPKPKDKVIVRVLLDGAMHLLFRDKPLAFIRCPPPKAAPAHKGPHEHAASH